MQKPNIKNLIRIHGFPESSVTAVRVQITNINVITNVYTTKIRIMIKFKIVKYYCFIIL